MRQNNPLLDAAPATDTRGGGAPAAPAAPAPNVTEVRNEAVRLERERVNAIREICKQAASRMSGAQEIGEKAVSEGQSADEVRQLLWQRMTNAKPLGEAETRTELDMSEKDISRYSLLRAISTLGSKKPLDGLEREVSDEVAKRCRRDPSGFFIPQDILRASKRGLNVNTATAGGYTVDTDLQTGSMIELLRKAMVFNTLGARSLTGLRGDVAIPKHTGGATAYWLSETETVTDSEQTFGQLKLTPHRLAAATAFSKQLVSQSSIDVEGFVRQDLMQVLAIEKDRACINGLGSGGEPLGILNLTGVSTVTFSAAATWAKLLSFIKTLKTNNALQGNIAWLTTPAVEEKWKQAVKFSSTASPLWTDENTVGGYRAVTSNQFPSGDKVIFGNFSDFIIADWDGIDITVDPYTLATSGQIRVIIAMLTDTAARHAESFVRSTDSGAQ